MISIKIAPSILSANFGAFAEATQQLSVSGADYIHIDVMDGRFVPNITFGDQLVRDLRPVTTTPFDIHLMIENPEQHVADFAQAGADMITIHPETTYHLQRVLQQIRDAGAKAGVALNPATPLSAIEWVLNDLDRVLIMTVNPGFGGQKFLREMLHKITRLAEMRAQQGLAFEIGVDGGVNSETASLAAGAGADVLIAGSAVFDSGGDFQGAIAKIREAAEAAAG